MGRVHHLGGGWTIKPSRFTEEQIIAILREQEAGAATADVCRKHGIGSATFYKWKGEVWRAGSLGRQAVEGTGGREREAEEAAGGNYARHGHAEGCGCKKMVTPAAR